MKAVQCVCMMLRFLGNLLGHSIQGRREVWKSGGGNSNLVGMICPPYWNSVHQPKFGPRAPGSAGPALPCAGGEFNNLLRSIFEFSHFTRAFIWQTIFDPSLFVFFSHLFFCYLTFQKFVKISVCTHFTAKRILERLGK